MIISEKAEIRMIDGRGKRIIPEKAKIEFDDLRLKLRRNNIGIVRKIMRNVLEERREFEV